MFKLLDFVLIWWLSGSLRNNNVHTIYGNNEAPVLPINSKNSRDMTYKINTCIPAKARPDFSVKLIKIVMLIKFSNK